MNFFREGRMIADSKSGYDLAHPQHVTVYNANVCTRSKGKIWYGDLDLTLDVDKLKELAASEGEDVYVLRERHARFENEKNPLFENAVAIVSSHGITLCS